jgi:isocitrate dehydrogenase
VAAADGNARARILSDTLDKAVGKFLENGKSPSRRVNQLDNRGSNFYLALYWAQALAAQDQDAELKKRFAKLAEELGANEGKIADELNAAQGKPVEIGGYYHPDPVLTSRAMRPSPTLNRILEAAP